MFELPLFPLNTVLFPGMPLRLHIFEERYKAMLQNVMATNRTFGVNLIKGGAEALGPLPSPFEVGCTARVVQIEQLEDGCFNLTVIGDERFHVLRMSAGQPYLTAFVESTPLEAHHTMDVVRNAHSLRRQLARYLALLARANRSQEGENGIEINFDLTGMKLPEDPMMLIYFAAALLQVPAHEKQPLLEAETAALVLRHVQRLYRRELAVLPPTLALTRDEARYRASTN